MKDTAKYLIYATIAADGVVERSDVVGAVFGQTEGLLGDELDLRDLQQSSKVGRIDVAIESENGQSFGDVTVASSLDKAETAILAASLETITRVGPCRASVEVTSIEDVRAAKRREVVDRAKELLADGFEETSLSSDDVIEEVRDAAHVEGIADYEGLPAGPRVGDSDAVIVVEGRADVTTLLEAGIKNAVAVEGTNVPETVADLTHDRTVTAFLDGDRGGELILRELAQIGEIDHVAFAPAGRSVEDLDRAAVLDALRGKVPYSTLADEPNLREALDDADPDVTSDARTERRSDTAFGSTGSVPPDEDGSTAAATADDEDGSTAAATADDEDGDDGRRSFREHVAEVVTGGTGTARLLTEDGKILAEVDAEAAVDAVASADETPYAVVIDGEVTQRLLDVAAQRGVEQLCGDSTGTFVKKPIGTRVRTADDLRVEA